MKKTYVKTEYGTMGYYLADNFNTLVLTANKKVRKELKKTFEKEGYCNLEIPILNDIADYCNGGIVTTGDNIGQMTEAIIFGNQYKFGIKVYSDFNYYQIRSYINDLIEYGEAKFYAINDWDFTYLTYLQDMFILKLFDEEMETYWGRNWNLIYKNRLVFGRFESNTYP